MRALRTTRLPWRTLPDAVTSSLTGTPGLAVNALGDVAVADRYAVGVDDDPGRHGQHDVPVADRDRQVEGRLADDGGGEVDEDVAVPGLHRQAARHHPGSVPLDRAVGDLAAPPGPWPSAAGAGRAPGAAGRSTRRTSSSP